MMSDDLTELRERISKLSDGELAMMIGENSADYRQEAVYFATEELTMRGIPFYSPLESLSYAQTESPKGVGGCLLFFCLGLTIFNPIIALPFSIINITGASLFALKFPGYFSIMLLSSLISIVMTCFGFYVGVSLWRIKPDAVKIAKKFLLMFLVRSFVPFPLLYLVELPPKVKETIPTLIGVVIINGLFYFGVWYSYLTTSRRVKATYPPETDVPEDSKQRALNLNG
jgi:hypothetical protein